MDIREASSADAGFLAAMLEEAMNWNPERPRSTLAQETATWPELPRYVEDWGRPADVGLVAEEDGHPVGAAWFRLFTAERPGFGFLDEATPELSIALLPEARGRGIGTALLTALLERARDEGYERMALNAEIPNPARRLYARLGFVAVGEPDEGYQTMVLTLAPGAPGGMP
jgi:GNAT superfamily N-acetyltransferase